MLDTAALEAWFVRLPEVLAATDPVWLVAAIFTGVLAVCMVAVALLWRASLRRARADADRIAEQTTAQTQALHDELTGLKERLQSLSELSLHGQTQLSGALQERLDRVSQHLGEHLQAQQRDTAEQLSQLYQRLSVIDSAQAKIADLTGRVVSLQDILADKQARGAFGQMRMEAIIRDALPSSAYSFQPSLSNGTRPDCIVRLPGTTEPLVIDAKFPLENFERLRTAHEAEARKTAAAQIRQAVGRHVDAIADKYILAGETQDSALMFVPSESVYAEIYEHFPDLIQKAHKRRVIIVSPNMLMLAVQTMLSIVKDARMREQTDVLRKEVSALTQDVAKLAQRAAGLQRHHRLMGEELDKLAGLSETISTRGQRIDALDFDEAQPPAANGRATG
ncbi:DNA recombination protein RmuC [Dichotomicrobium thermohalophilum]|uniref:DNA recombination protein RmuC homolog n=1 Tax=Dichotomicrobium thermohalophilum TaxID=933063 RepID=A0A397QAF8_9HYPH|nr:DNA recombination protein RmuC [Dichotomicrobium thermohalophilum]RIA56795.1 DNA recombination protein RmuC [Dichotomicrobium thermohalophilum]